MKSKRGSLKVGKSLTRWQPGRSGNCIATYLAVRRDVSDATSGRNFFFTVAMRGNKVAIKKAFIATRYQFIIKELSASVIDVALI